MYVFEELFKRKMPKLYEHFRHNDVHTPIYAFRWLTLRFHGMPVELEVRIMDMFCLEGRKIVYRMALHLLQRFKSHMLSLEDMGGIISYLASFEKGGSPLNGLT